MIGIREEVTVRLEIEFRVLAGELAILEQNSLDLPLEKTVTIWADQIIGSRLMILLHELGDDSEEDKEEEKENTSFAALQRFVERNATPDQI